MLTMKLLDNKWRLPQIIKITLKYNSKHEYFQFRFCTTRIRAKKTLFDDVLLILYKKKPFSKFC